jgi:CDP-glucose 4,6-dehydratase
VNLLESARQSRDVESILIVTTDKVYRNNEWEWGYRETDALDGFDPYSNSKSCADLVSFAYGRSFFAARGVPISTARAGNVIGGGDFSANRILPDCVRAAAAGRPVLLRNPHSVRPYQHVLEPLWAYLLIAQRQVENPALAGAYNVGPEESDCITTGVLAGLFCRAWGAGASFETPEANRPVGPHEANFLRLDSARIRAALGWRPRWGIARAVAETVAWSKAHLAGEDLPALMDAQIAAYLAVTEEV